MNSKVRRTFALLGRARIGAARPALIVGLLAIFAPLVVLLMHSARAQLASSPWPMFHQNLLHTGLSLPAPTPAARSGNSPPATS